MNIKSIKKPKALLMLATMLAVIVVAATAISLDTDESDAAATTYVIDLGTVTVDQGQTFSEVYTMNTLLPYQPGTYSTNYSWATGSIYTLSLTRTAMISGNAPSAAGTYNVTFSTPIITDAVIYSNITVKLQVVVTAPPPPTITISFISNGGAGSVSSQQVVAGNSITLPSVGFTKDGYYQGAWLIGSTSGGSYNMGAIFTASTSNVTFYAAWYLRPAGSFFDTNAPSTATVNKAWTYSPDLSTTAVAPWSNYWDLYWHSALPMSLNLEISPSGFNASNTYSDGIKFSWTPTTPGVYLVSMNMKNVATGTLYYPIYFIITVFPTTSTTPTTYTVTYDSNGGNGTIANNSGIMPNNAITLPGQVFTRSGYTQVGWQPSIANPPVHLLGQTYTVTANVTMKAYWVSNPNIVVFNSNGGTGTIDPFIAYTDGQITLPSTGLTRSGYTLEGWYLQSNQDAIYSKGYVYTIGDNVTFYAYWVPTTATTYTVTVDSNGGTGTYSQKVEPGKGVVLPLVGIQKTSNILMGFSTSNSSTTPSFLPKDVYTPSGTATLYAVWQDATTSTFFTVSFNLNGGSGSIIPQNIIAGGVAIRPSVNPTKTASIFSNWYLQNGGLWNFATPINSNITLMAEYNEHFSFTQKDLMITLTLGGNFATGSTVINWGDGTDTTITGTSSSHTYSKDMSGTITVTTTALAGTFTSTSNFAVSGQGGGGEEDPDDSTDWIHIVFLLAVIIVMLIVTFGAYMFMGVPGLAAGAIITLGIVLYLVTRWFI